MVIVETDEEFTEFSSTPWTTSIVIPIFTDIRKHYMVNTVCFLYVRTNVDTYIFPFNHPDARNLPVDALSRLAAELLLRKNYTTHPTALMSLFGQSYKAYDLKGLQFLQTGVVTDDRTLHTTTQRHTYRKLRNDADINCCVPIMKLIEWCDVIADGYMEYVDAPVPSGFEFHATQVVDTIGHLERSGIHIEASSFVEKFGDTQVSMIKDSCVYTEFNPYTTTHRITSKFNNVNFSGLNKSDGTRAMFTSRFEQGGMVLIDFESFHLRLIADMLQYTLPTTSVHEYFAQQYFDTDVVTPEQYDESKQHTFSLLYGSHATTDIPFFVEVQKYITTLWDRINVEGYIESPTGYQIRLDRIDAPSPAKLFNYYLQLREMEESMRLIHSALWMFTQYQSKCVLYTYDSVLIDYNKEDGMAFLQTLVALLEDGGKYPVRVYAGQNYDVMKNITEKIK